MKATYRLMGISLFAKNKLSNRNKKKNRLCCPIRELCVPLEAPTKQFNTFPLRPTKQIYNTIYSIAFSFFSAQIFFIYLSYCCVSNVRYFFRSALFLAKRTQKYRSYFTFFYSFVSLFSVGFFFFFFRMHYTNKLYFT